VGQAFVTWSKTPVAVDNEWGSDDPVVGELTSTANLQFRADAANASHTISWQVVEFVSSADVDVQKGTTSMAAGTTSVAVALPAAVDLTKSFALVGYRTSAPCTDMGSCVVRARLTAAGTLTIDRSNSSLALTEVTWQVVQLTDGSRVQAGNASFASGAATATAALGSMAASRAVAFASGQTGGGQSSGRTSYAADDLPGAAQATLTVASPTQLTLTRGSTVAAADVAWFVIELRSP
jgi:hypothetical protein